MSLTMMLHLMLTTLLLLAMTVHARPADVKDLPLPSSSATHKLTASLNPDDIAVFTNMFLSLFKGIADWRNMVAADAVQSVWQSPLVVDFSKRIFAV